MIANIFAAAMLGVGAVLVSLMLTGLFGFLGMSVKNTFGLQPTRVWSPCREIGVGVLVCASSALLGVLCRLLIDLTTR
jgi:hypothetical protein